MADLAPARLNPPMAYDGGRHALPLDPLAELRKHDDPAIRLWAAAVQAIGRDDAEALRFLEREATFGGDFEGLASHLFVAATLGDDPGKRGKHSTTRPSGSPSTIRQPPN